MSRTIAMMSNARLFGIAAGFCLLLGGCGGNPPAPEKAAAPSESYSYLIGPLDTLQITVWRNPNGSSSSSSTSSTSTGGTSGGSFSSGGGGFSRHRF